MLCCGLFYIVELNCRGLAAVHSYDRSLCHRDVKSFNFLVDHQFNVKIADLELGIMAGEEGLSSYQVNAGRYPFAEEMVNQSDNDNHGYIPPSNSPLHEEGSFLLGRDSSNTTSASVSVTPSRQISDPECVNVNELLANWLAPEVNAYYKEFTESCVHNLLI